MYQQQFLFVCLELICLIYFMCVSNRFFIRIKFKHKERTWLSSSMSPQDGTVVLCLLSARITHDSYASMCIYTRTHATMYICICEMCICSLSHFIFNNKYQVLQNKSQINILPSGNYYLEKILLRRNTNIAVAVFLARTPVAKI